VAIAFDDLTNWFTNNLELGVGIILIFFGLLFTLSELRVYLKHQSPPDQLLLWLMVLLAGIITATFEDFVFGLLMGISIIMIVETIKLWDTPVWGKLMAATTASYLVILGGKIGQIVYDYLANPDEPNEQIFGTAFNISFFVFIGVAFAFFGRKFILVSRLSSPQMIYLFLFGVLYGVLVFLQKRKILFVSEGGTATKSYDYLNISADWADRVIFANFGTYEALIILMVFMYSISGWLLSTLFGVKDITDQVLLDKVHEVARTMGINEELKVGHVSAPILNAFAYGPFFDKRIAFISSDISEFNDEDIRGIVGHELAHSAKNHVVILLFLSVFELGVKKVLEFPATTLDYSFFKDAGENISLASYYAFNYAFFVFLLIIVRTLEGHADKVTKEAGYGEDLSKALFRLEGFYHGVASDFGISVNLLTDRKYSIAEKRRFTAIAGRSLYGEVLAPTRGSAFANVFQSHPRTSYRIASLVTDDVDPMKAAFLPYRLLGFRMRKGAIKQLNKIEHNYHKLIDESYLNDYDENALAEVLSFNPIKESYEYYLGKQVIVYDRIKNKAFEGEFTNLKTTMRVTSPVEATIGDNQVDLAKLVIREYNIGDRYLLRDGSIVKIQGSLLDEKDGLLIQVLQTITRRPLGKLFSEVSSEESVNIPISKLGRPISFIENLSGKEVILFDKGISKLSVVNSIELADSWKNSKISFNGEYFSGTDFIIDFPPLGIEVRKDKIKEQRDLLSFLVGQKIILYTKDNFDVSLSGNLLELTETHIKLEDADGVHEIEVTRLEYIVLDQPIAEFIRKDHISFFTKVGIRWSNRNEFNYVVA
jgi:Zn-dependent protease with chaperone function